MNFVVTHSSLHFHSSLHYYSSFSHSTIIIRHYLLRSLLFSTQNNQYLSRSTFVVPIPFHYYSLLSTLSATLSMIIIVRYPCITRFTLRYTCIIQHIAIHPSINLSIVLHLKPLVQHCTRTRTNASIIIISHYY
jgi:hypothetical protein